MTDTPTKPPEMLEADRVANEAILECPPIVRGDFTVWCVIRNAFLMGRGYGRAEGRSPINIPGASKRDKDA